MKISDQYHKWVEWSDEDQVYLGLCPDLITGIHGDDPKVLYSELCEVVDEVIEERQRAIADRARFQMTDHSLHIYGICSRCAD